VCSTRWRACVRRTCRTMSGGYGTPSLSRSVTCLRALLLRETMACSASIPEAYWLANTARW
jgi:hypothetical protein